MPSPEASNRYQKAVLWEFLRNDRHGDPVHSPGDEILVRWVETQRQVRDKDSNLVSIDSEAIVNQEITVGSVMWLGEARNLTDNPTNLKEVVQSEFATDVKGRAVARCISMKRYAGKLQIAGTGT